MSDKIKIAHLQLLPLLSGVQQVSYQELTLLPDADFQADIICRERGQLVDALEAEGIGFHPVSALQRAIHPVKDFIALRELWSLFRQQGYDVVHTHSSKTGFLGRVAARLAGVRCIVHTVHGFAFPAARSKLEYAIYWLLEWIAGRCCNAVIVLTESDRQICLNSLGLRESKVHLIPNGIDTEKYHPPSPDRRFEIRQQCFDVDDEKTIVVLMVGRLWRQKAPECLVEAAINLLEPKQESEHELEKNIQVYLVGDGELLASLEQRIQESGFEEKIHLMGWRSDVPQLLQAADLFVLPSRWEGLSLAILEAMASGVAVIASDIPGNRAALADGDCGRLFPVDNSELLQRSIQDLVDDSKERERLVKLGLKKIYEKHLLSKRVDKLVELYEEFLR